MIKKAKETPVAEPIAPVSNTASSDYVKGTSREYSIYVCSSRAIPNISDGLKDSQRKALWMLRNKGEKIKTVSLSGEMISEGIYLSGDMSASMAISMLAAPYVNNVPLIHGIGAFGTRVAPVDGIGAPRYTYVKKTAITDGLVYNDKDIIPLKDNYDGSVKEPEHFLPLIPLVLLNGVSGIAVGWSTEILPRNIKKLIAATQAALDGKEPKGLEPAYDYLNVGVKQLEDNVWEISGSAKVIDTSTIQITELPPGVTLEAFKKRLNKMEDEDKIHSYTDKSTSEINILVKFKRGTVAGWSDDKAVDYFKMRQRVTERIVVIDWNGQSIRQYDSAATVVKEFVQWRLGWYTKRYQKMLDDDSYELKYWQGLKACFDDKLPERLIKKTDKDAILVDVQAVTAAIGLDADQMDKIVSLSTFRWAKDYYAVIKENIARLQGNIKEYKAILKSPDRLKGIFATELDELKKLKM
jgi:DNA gyrase/topoisomerase IV subunit A